MANHVQLFDFYKQPTENLAKIKFRQNFDLSQSSISDDKKPLIVKQKGVGKKEWGQAYTSGPKPEYRRLYIITISHDCR